MNKIFIAFSLLIVLIGFSAFTFAPYMFQANLQSSVNQTSFQKEKLNSISDEESFLKAKGLNYCPVNIAEYFERSA